MKTRKGINVEAQAIKGSKELTIVLSGNCFTRICNDQRNFQSLATLLSYCTNLLAYSFTSGNKYGLCQMIKQYASKNSKLYVLANSLTDFLFKYILLPLIMEGKVFILSYLNYFNPIMKMIK